MGHEKRKSKYRNVYWYKKTGQWLVKLHARNNPSGKETVNVDYYWDEEVAARVADVAAYLVSGPEAKLNFPLVDDQPLPPPSVPRAVIVERLLHLNAILPEG
jgi:hypothetical protein